jgi:RNA polymerase sigma-70 factor (ECF subfamily)
VLRPTGSGAAGLGLPERRAGLADTPGPRGALPHVVLMRFGCVLDEVPDHDCSYGGFSAAEVAGQLGTSVPAVNSALQRARGAARATLPPVSQQAALRSLGADGAARLARHYADALEAADADTLVGMLTADATWSMPPHPTWYRGHDIIRRWLITDPLTVRWRHLPTWANGQLAVGCYGYADDAGRYLPWVIDVLTLSPTGREIAAVTAFVVSDEPDPAAIFDTFDLPPELP